MPDNAPVPDILQLNPNTNIVFDGSEGYAFWVSDADGDASHPIHLADFPKVIEYLGHWFPGAFEEHDKHVNATTVRAIQGALREIIHDLDDLLPKGAIEQSEDEARIASYTEKCDGSCGDDSPHSGHLTAAGRKHYLGEELESRILAGEDLEPEDDIEVDR